MCNARARGTHIRDAFVRGGRPAARIPFAPLRSRAGPPPPSPAPHPPSRARMTIMSDRWITRMATEHGMIEPFEGRQVRQGVISYGVSSYGYDMRVAREFRIFTNVLNSIVDPKNFESSCFVEFEGDVCI